LHAYEKLKGISPDFVMKGNFPEPVSSSTDVAAAPSVLAVGASQQVLLISLHIKVTPISLSKF